MATLYFAPTTGAIPFGDTRVHPVNGSSSNTGSSRFSPLDWDAYKGSYQANDRHIFVDSYGPSGVAYGPYKPTIAQLGSPSFSWYMPTNIPNNGNLIMEAENKGPFKINPYGDLLSNYEDMFERTVTFAGWLVFGAGVHTITLKNFKVQMKGALARTPDTTAGETWSSVYANYDNLNGQARQSLIQNDVGNSAGTVWDLDGIEFDGGWGSNFDPFDPNAYLPEFASDDSTQVPQSSGGPGNWADTAGVAARPGGNNVYRMPGAFDVVNAGGVTAKNCYVHDLHHGFNIHVGNNANIFIKNNCFERLYQDGIQTVLLNNTWQWGERVLCGNVFVDFFGHPFDQGNPHGDGLQDFMSYTINAASPRFGRGPMMFNNIAIMRGRATVQWRFLEARDGGTGPFAYDYVMSRNELGVAVYKFESIGAARTADLRRGIGIIPTDKTTSAMNGQAGVTASIQLTSLPALQSPGASFIEEMLYEQNLGMTPQTRQVNNSITGNRGASVNGYADVFNSTATLAANGTINDWYTTLHNRKTAYAGRGPQGYPSFRAWRDEPGTFAANPFPSRISFSSYDDVATSTVITSIPEIVVTNVMPSAVAGLTASTDTYTPGASESYIEVSAFPMRTLVVPSTGVFTFPSHGFTNGQTKRVVSRNHNVAGTWSTTVTLYVVNATTDTFQLSLANGGAAITGAGSGPFEVYICAMSEVVNDWRTTAGTVTGGNYLVRKGTSSATPSTQTRFVGSLGGYQTTWSVTTASNNIWPRCGMPGDGRFERAALGGQLTNGNYFGHYMRAIFGDVGTAKGVAGFITGSAGWIQHFITNTNTMRLRLRNNDGTPAVLVDIDFGTFDRTGTVITEFFVVVDTTQADRASGVFAYKRSGGTGAWTRISVTGAWGGTSRLINYQYNSANFQVFGLNDYLKLTGMEAMYYTTELLDVTDDPTNPAILAKLKPDWIGEFGEGLSPTGTKPWFFMVGKASALNQTNPLNKGTVTTFTRQPTGVDTVAVNSTWFVPLTTTSEIDVSSPSPYLDGTATNILYKPIGYANAVTVTPSIGGVAQTPVAVPKGSDGAVISLNLTGPATRSVSFTNNGGNIDPATLNVEVWKRYPFTLSKADSPDLVTFVDVAP